MKKSEILVILDLDETLIHVTADKLDREEDFFFDKYYVYKRPSLDNFLSILAEHFKIAIWSSASDDYVDIITKYIKPIDITFDFVWGRSRCTLRRDFEMDTYYWEKKLDKLKRKGFKLEQILIVDDSPEKAKSNFGNAIYVNEFLGNPDDRELEILLKYLISLRDAPNVRTIEKRDWKTGLNRTI